MLPALLVLALFTPASLPLSLQSQLLQTCENFLHHFYFFGEIFCYFSLITMIIPSREESSVYPKIRVYFCFVTGQRQRCSRRRPPCLIRERVRSINAKILYCCSIQNFPGKKSMIKKLFSLSLKLHLQLAARIKVPLQPDPISTRSAANSSRRICRRHRM